MEPYLGQVCLFGFDFAPRNWAPCIGQLLPISQNTALFSLFGTMYGGDGRTTFQLPDLRGRVPIGQGPGGGLPGYSLGQRGGSEQHTLLSGEMPAHTHAATVTAALHAESAPADRANPAGAMLAGARLYALPDPANDRVMASESLAVSIQNQVTGGSAPLRTRDPFLGLNYSVALAGIFPGRN